MYLSLLQQAQDQHAADWYLIYREAGKKQIHHKVFSTYDEANHELQRHVNEGISDIDEVIIRPYRLSQKVTVR